VHEFAHYLAASAWSKGRSPNAMKKHDLQVRVQGGDLTTLVRSDVGCALHLAEMRGCTPRNNRLRL